MHKCGSIILLYNHKGIFPKLVKFFTKAPYSHCAITMGNLVRSESILTAEGSGIFTHPLQRYFETPYYEFSIYEIQEIKEEKLEELVLELYNKTVYKKYGTFQNMWFMYRWFMELFGIDVRKQGNWFPNNYICSEETYELLLNIAEITSNKKLQNKLNEWNSNCFSPADLKTIIDSFPNMLKKVK